MFDLFGPSIGCQGVCERMGHVHAWVECVFGTVSECVMFSLYDVCMTALQFVFGKSNSNVAKYLAEQVCALANVLAPFAPVVTPVGTSPPRAHINTCP